MISQKDILVFGDSIVYGAWDPTGGGWVNRLRQHLEQKVVSSDDVIHRVFNLGVSGETSLDVLKHDPSEIVNRTKSDHQLVVIFGVGTNDSARVKDLSPQIAPDEYMKNMAKLITLAKHKEAIVICLSLLGVNESLVAPAPWHTEIFYRQKYIEEYNNLLRRVTDEQRVSYLDFGDTFTRDVSLFDDGVHPNSKGHQVIAEKVLDYLESQCLV